MFWHFASVLVLSAAGGAAVAQAQSSGSYPSRPVRIVVPQSPGASTDLTARLLAQKLSPVLGQSVIVDNRPGAGSLVGTEVVAKATPDGHTLLVVASSLTLNPVLRKNLGYDPVSDFAPITQVSSFANMITVHPTVPVKTVQDLIALAKSKPGSLNYASSGNGTPYHMAGELFKSMAGVDLVHIPHKGSDQARAAVLGGQVQMMFDGVPTMAASARAGKVKALATSGAKRSAVTPDVPTLSEAGVPGYESGIWLGLMAPAKTPRPVLEKLNMEVNKLLNSAEVRDNWGKQGTMTMGMSIEQFEKFLREEIVKWAKVVKISGAKAD